jgi:hypothetical protein
VHDTQISKQPTTAEYPKKQSREDANQAAFLIVRDETEKQ